MIQNAKILDYDNGTRYNNIQKINMIIILKVILIMF